MIKIGSLNLTDMKVGTSSVLSGYVGTELVYPYSYVNSIWSTSANNRIWFPVYTSDGLNLDWEGYIIAYRQSIIFGWTGSTNGSRWNLYYPSANDTDNWQFRINNTAGQITTAAQNIPINTLIELKLGNHYINKDGVDLVTGTTKTLTGTGNQVFANMQIARTKSIKWYDGNTLLFDGKPAVKCDGTVGLLDSVSGGFFPIDNQTTARYD